MHWDAYCIIKQYYKEITSISIIFMKNGSHKKGAAALATPFHYILSESDYLAIITFST